jgi:hypothetical protein
LKPDVSPKTRSPFELLSDTTKQWGALIASIGALFGGYYGFKLELQEIRSKLSRLEDQIIEARAFERDVLSVGPDGFRNHQVRAAMEAHLNEYATRHAILTNDFVESFFQLNPELKKPAVTRPR